jgi:hypothetical protein
MAHAVTEYDRKQAGKVGYNHYALAHYLGAVTRITEDIAAGTDARRAVLVATSGRLASVILRSLGLPAITRDEARGSF